MKLLQFIFLCLFSCFSLLAMHKSSELPSRSMTRASEKKAFIEYVMNRQNWSDITRQYYLENPTDPDVQILDRYIKVMKKKISCKPGQSVLDAAKNAPFEYGGADEDFIFTGRCKSGAYTAIVSTEYYWLDFKLPDIEERIDGKFPKK